MPKSLDISKAIDKRLNAEREVIGWKTTPDGKRAIDRHPTGFNGEHEGWDRPWKHDIEAVERQASITKPATPESEQWNGWGTGLKPSSEHWILCRAPLAAKTIAENVLAYGCGGLNIAASRIAGVVPQVTQGVNSNGSGYQIAKNKQLSQPHELGRFPSNTLISHTIECKQTVAAYDCSPYCAVRLLDEQSGVSKSTIRPPTGKQDVPANSWAMHRTDTVARGHIDQGGASRYFQTFQPTADDHPPFLYASKPSRRERNSGCEALPEREAGAYGNFAGDGRERQTEHTPSTNNHPTVKSLALCRYLIRMITRPGGVVLDMFAGSGSVPVSAVLEGMSFIAIDENPEYCAIAEARIAHALAAKR